MTIDHNIINHIYTRRAPNTGLDDHHDDEDDYANLLRCLFRVEKSAASGLDVVRNLNNGRTTS